ncbi:MAG: hypothetical protein Q8928_02505 [Bacteroidota bacterium]|nr:hypothetical protein [Bacteroidota bacterium]
MESLKRECEKDFFDFRDSVLYWFCEEKKEFPLAGGLGYHFADRVDMFKTEMLNNVTSLNENKREYYLAIIKSRLSQKPRFDVEKYLNKAQTWRPCNTKLNSANKLCTKVPFKVNFYLDKPQIRELRYKKLCFGVGLIKETDYEIFDYINFLLKPFEHDWRGRPYKLELNQNVQHEPATQENDSKGLLKLIPIITEESINKLWGEFGQYIDDDVRFWAPRFCDLDEILAKPSKLGKNCEADSSFHALITILAFIDEHILCLENENKTVEDFEKYVLKRWGIKDFRNKKSRKFHSCKHFQYKIIKEMIQFE